MIRYAPANKPGLNLTETDATAGSSPLVTGVNGLVSTLTNYDVFGGSSAGAIVSVIAIARSDVASN